MICSKCNKEFDKLIKGLCRKCYDKMRYKENRNTILKQHEQWRNENKDDIKHYRKQYREDRLSQYVYIAICGDSGLYIGSTSNINERISKHKTGHSTIPIKPIGIIYQNYPNISELERLQLEKYLIETLKPKHNKKYPTVSEIKPHVIKLGNEFLNRIKSIV